MKVLLFAFAMIATVSVTTISQAAAPSDAVSNQYTYDSHRAFNSTRTAGSLGCSDCGATAQFCQPGTQYHFYGYLTNGHQCREYIGKLDGTVDTEKLARIQESEAREQSDLDQVFDGNRTLASYWGYVTTLARSPNAGRNLLIEGKLDICLGWSNVDAIMNSSTDIYTQWTTCTGTSYCGSSLKNSYCAANSSQVCIDRCNCKYQQGLVALGYPDPGCSNM